MRISYRTSSIAVLLVFAGMFLVPIARMIRPRTLLEGAASLDLCRSWEQFRLLIQISTLIWFATFLSLFVQGLRNRTTPRVVAIISLTAFFIGPVDQLWRVQYCEANLAIVIFSIWSIVVGLACLHHIVQRPVRA